MPHVPEAWIIWLVKKMYPKMELANPRPIFDVAPPPENFAFSRAKELAARKAELDSERQQDRASFWKRCQNDAHRARKCRGGVPGAILFLSFFGGVSGVFPFCF